MTARKSFPSSFPPNSRVARDASGEARPDDQLELGGLDSAIFRELQTDGRMPFGALADRVGVSEAHVRRRVKHLTETDVFSITAVADPRLLGLGCMAQIGLVVHPGSAGSVAEALVEQSEIDYVVQCAGQFSVMAEAACRSTADLHRLLVTLRKLPGVRKCETFVYLNLLHQRFQWTLLAGHPQKSSARGIGQADELESLDIELIRELERDGRAPFREIARNLRVSERLISTRFRRLVENGVLQVIAVGNPEALGFRAMAWLGIHLAEDAEYERVVASLSTAQGIDYVVETTGRFELMAEIVCRCRQDLLRALEDEVGTIRGIEHIETFFYLRLLYKSSARAWGASRTLVSAAQA